MFIMVKDQGCEVKIYDTGQNNASTNLVANFYEINMKN